MQKVYKFRPFRVVKENPIGNIRLDLRSPTARSGHRIVADNGNVYSFGGYNPHMDRPNGNSDDFIWVFHCLLFKELWKYNIATKTWIKLKTSGRMPEELASHAISLLGNTLLVFGGTGVPFGMRSSNSVHLCDLKTLNWTEFRTNGELPMRQYGQAIAVDNKKLYVVGGTTGFEYSMNVHSLDFKTRKWTEIVPLVPQPEPRYRHEMVVDNNKLYIFGGGTSATSFTMKEVPIFDVEQKTWTTAFTSKDNPGPRRCHSCVRIGDDIYISGGQNEGTIFSDIWQISLSTMKWLKLPCQLPRPVYFHSATVTPEGQMFVFGGVTTTEGNVRTNDLHSVWLKIPSLKEISWLAILHYVPHIGEMEPRCLLSAGIPQELLERIEFVE